MSEREIFHGRVEDGRGQEHADWDDRGRRGGDRDDRRHHRRDWDDDYRGGFNPWMMEYMRFPQPGIVMMPQPEIVMAPPMINDGGCFGNQYDNQYVYGGRYGFQAGNQFYNNNTLYNPAYNNNYYANQWNVPQTYAPQTYAPQTYAPQTYAPQTYYQGNSVYGGRGGFQANNQSFNSSVYNPGYGVDNSMAQAGQAFNMGLTAFDTFAAFDIARRYANRR